MKKVMMNIYGGTAVRPKTKKFRMTGLPWLVLLSVLALSTSAFAQGSIFGTVTNSDLTTPANGEITFVGFLDDTDEEIRIESSDGAGYDAGNWFDDFQNYLTEAPGNPYDYYFYNLANSEAFHLEKLIPNNSFQQEDVALAPAGWPMAPSGFNGVAVSSSTTIIGWNGVAGLTYHVYRRMASSNGSFFRLDDPAGLLTNPGVTDSFFVDATVDGVSSYDYLIIAEDPSGNYSPHSAILTVNSAVLSAPVVSSVNPNSGTASGGVQVNVYGQDFDPAGASVSFGATPATAMVLSPFHMTVVSPPGTPGLVDISATNTSSGLSSNVLTGGFTYTANAEPVLDPIGPQPGTEGVLLQFAVTSSDLDGDTPILSTSTLPGTAGFVDNGDGTGQFTWTPSYTDAGVYDVMFYATDAVVPTAIDSEQVQITISDAGNQPPVLTPVNDTSVAEGGALLLVITASDPDGEIPTLSASNYPTNANFLDNGDGTGDFTFNPDYTQSGVYDVIFKALDAALEVDSIIVQITVTDVNQLPILAAIGPQNTTENIPLDILVSTSDADGTIPVLSTSSLPGTAVFTDSLNGFGLFEWTPTFADSGTYTVTFYSTDSDHPTDIDSEQVVITVLDAGNQAPVLAAMDSQYVAEGGSLTLVVSSTDPDGTTPALTAENLPANASFGDSLDGTGQLDFNPDFTQAGVYDVIIIAADGILADTGIVTITVTEGGNVAPIIDSLGDFAVDEGGSLVLTITATDPDGGAIYSALSVNTTLNNYTFTDNGDGTGTLTYLPDFFDAGIDSVFFFATDYGTPQQTSSSVSEITTVDINQPPVIDSIGPFGVAVDDSLIFTITASDSTDPDTMHRLFLSTIGAPANSDFTDNGDGTGTFAFQPTAAQEGLITVTFLAVDQGVPQQSFSLDVDINVVLENIPPVIDPIDPQTIVEGEDLTIIVTASDPDGPPPAIDTVDAPEFTTFIDNGNGSATFIFGPNFVGGTRLTSVRFSAYDGIAITVTQPILIQIYDAGNQVPVFDPVEPDSVVEGETLELLVSAYDPDGEPIFLAVDEAALHPNMSFVDSGNGIGVITFSPDYTQAGLWDVDVFVYDGPVDDPGTLGDTTTLTISVIEAGNQLPVLGALSDHTVTEANTLAFVVTATDPDGTYPALSAAPLPPNATLTDNGDGTGDFEFTPDLTQDGIYDIMFYADDGLEIDSALSRITVYDNNQLPFVFASGGRQVYEGDTLTYVVESFDADGTLPFLYAFISGTDSIAADSLPLNMTFEDTRDGFGTLTFMPNYDQGGPVSNPLGYNIRFKAVDEDYPDVYQFSANVLIEVIDRNQPPYLVFPDGEGPFTLTEGDLLTFGVGSLDPDGSFSPTLTALNMPDSNVTFDPFNGYGLFTFQPDFTQSGTYQVTFICTDEHMDADTQIVQIDVLEAGNQSPYFTTTIQPSYNIPIEELFQLNVEAYDPELDSIILEATPILQDASFIDNGDGTGTYSYLPDPMFLDSVYEITFVVTDYPGGAADTAITQFAVVTFLRGDLDDNKRYTMNDLAFLIGYLFRNGPEPAIIESADVDGDDFVNISDITYLIIYMYYNGPPPPQ